MAGAAAEAGWPAALRAPAGAPGPQGWLGRLAGARSKMLGKKHAPSEPFRYAGLAADGYCKARVRQRVGGAARVGGGARSSGRLLTHIGRSAAADTTTLRAAARGATRRALTALPVKLLRESAMLKLEDGERFSILAGASLPRGARCLAPPRAARRVGRTHSYVALLNAMAASMLSARFAVARPVVSRRSSAPRAAARAAAVVTAKADRTLWCVPRVIRAAACAAEQAASR